MKQIFYTVLFLLSYNFSYNQSLNGFWKGYSERSIFVLNPTEIILEMEVNNDTILSGIIHSYYSKGRYDHIKIIGHINWRDSIFYIVDEKAINHNINTKIYENCLGTMKLRFTKTDQSYKLEGKWRDNSKKLIRCPTLGVYYVKQFTKTHDLDKKDSVIKRRTDIQNLIELATNEADSIKLTLYDNAEVDNDTASVFLNDSLILKSQRLSQTPIDVMISLDKTIKIHYVKLVADNLGSIPPNTALLVIKTRKNRYSITLSSDYSQNGTVEFFLKE